ncbi:hypothetical protein [Gemmobacter lutimaris]|nr:hypothetical protein [Gemmobacter lutimaris]
MLKEVKAIITRSRATMLEDAVGAISLFVLLIVGLNLPGLA